MSTKVFVYRKDDSKKIAEFKDVETVYHEDDKIVFELKGGIYMEFDTKVVKTTSYQN